MKPQGLYYYPKAIPRDLSNQLQSFLDNDCDLFSVPGWNGKISNNARKVAHYGFKYNYTAGSVTEPAPDFPAVIEELCVLIYTTHEKDLSDGYWFNQCIINRYLPGQGIGTHTDRKEYGEYIACFTLNGGAEMEFTERDGGVYKIYVEPNSLYIMSGESRRNWLHQQRPRKSDPEHGQRGIRWSLTFRAV